MSLQEKNEGSRGMVSAFTAAELSTFLKTSAVRTGSARRRYDERGIYYEWDDGPHGWD